MNGKFLMHLASLMLLCGAASVHAQDYDDDIYYNPDKAKKEKKVKTNTESVTRTLPTAYGTASSASGDYLPASSYQPQTTGVNRDVDEYNRRGVFADIDTLQSSGAVEPQDEFAYTKRIERFYNPEVVAESGDPELASIYYSTTPEVNIYINNPGYGYNYWGYPYFGDPWYWGYPRYSWSLAWGSPWYGPSWSWSWNWGWNWGWGPSWAWRPSWGWGRPVIAYPSRPSWHNRPGAVGNVRPPYGGNRPGNRPTGVGTSRPGYGGANQGMRPGRTGNRRPATGYGNGSTRPSRNDNSGYHGNSRRDNSSFGTGSHSSGGFRGGSYGGGHSGGSRGGGGTRGRH